jgi:DNA polymerase III subunit epsilon
MRQIVLDTETTGLNPRSGNRIIEIGCVELINRRLTGNNFHYYLNPERDSEEGALAVHGLTTEFLKDKPKFADIVTELSVYIQDADVVIHNAPFDVSFLEAEFKRLKMRSFMEHVAKVTDTLAQAKEIHPGKRNSLDALCDRYGISNAHRTLHGALLDAELLAEVYLAMTRGQNSLTIDTDVGENVIGSVDSSDAMPISEILLLAATEDELIQHEMTLSNLDKAIRGSCIWRQIVIA